MPKWALRWLGPVLMLLIGLPVWGQVVLAEWNFPNNPDDALVDVAIPQNAGASLQLVGATNLVFVNAGVSTRSAWADGWNGGAGSKYWEVEINTVGFDVLQVSSRQTSSNTGPRSFEFQYRIGAAGAWTFLATVPNIVTANNWTQGVLNNVALPAACAGQPSVFLRWVMASNTAVDNSTVASGGASRIDDIVIRGQSNAHYRSVVSGNWNNIATWETSPTGTDPWAPALTPPTFNARTITVRNGHTVSIVSSTSADELTVENGATLEYNAGTLTLNNGIGVDLQVNGTFWDASTSPVGWATGPTWAMGMNGRYIKSSSTAAAPWRDNYHGGVVNMPESATWVIRKSGTMNPTVAAVGMVYPNLTIENTVGGTYDAIAVGTNFNGTLNRPVILGNLDVGGSGPGNVIFYNTHNQAGEPIPILGNLIVRAGSVLVLGTTSVGCEGFAVDGDITCNGTIAFNSAGSTSRRITLREGNPQTISGSGTFNTWNLRVNKSVDDVTLGMSISVANNLDLVNGRIVNDGTPHVVTLGVGSTVTNASNNSFVTGRVRKRGHTAFTFPVGKGTDMQPIGMNAVSAPATGITLWTENFTGTSGDCAAGCLANGYTTSRGTWSVTATGINGVSANNWYISSSTQCSANGNTLHISTNAGGVCATEDCGAFYNDNAASVTDLLVSSPEINLSSFTNVNSLQFDLALEGVSGLDFMSIMAFNGSAWVDVITPLTPLPGPMPSCGPYSLNSGFLSSIISGVPNARIGFRWRNNGNGVRGPNNFSVAIDNIRLIGDQAADSYVAEYFPIDGTLVYNDIVNTPLDHVSRCEYWVLEREIGTQPRNVTLHWDGNSCGVTLLSDLRVAHWDASAPTPSWFDRGNTGTTGNELAGTVTSGPNNLFGPFTLASISSQNPLPVTLLSFDGQVQGDQGVLRWRTATEKDNAWFELLSSGPNDTEWAVVELLGRIPGAGDSWTVQDYRFVDDRPNKLGTYYYQLRQVDRDGTATLSGVVPLTYLADPGRPSVFPNPITAESMVSVSMIHGGTMEVRVLNALGQLLHSSSMGVDHGSHLIPIGSLVPSASGVYFLELLLGDQRSSVRVVRQ